MKQRKTYKWLVWQTFFVASMLLVCIGLVSLPGCRPSDSTDSSSDTAGDEAERFQEEYFQYAVENLQRIQDFAGGEMRQQIVDRLNQWIPTQQLPTNWEADPMLEGLSIKVDREALGDKRFTVSDGYALQQAIWMRELSKWTCGDSNDPVQRGEQLFDWIVGNIMLQKAPEDGLGKMPKLPWETLFFGRGTSVDRAWVFILAARQQAIDAVLLMVPSQEDPEKLIPWAIGLMKDKELYLFDPELGLPIPAKEGVSLEGIRLVIKPATLSQILDDPTILKQLDISDTEHYPISIEQIQKTVAMIPASSSALSAKFALIESRMAGDKRAVLTIKPSALAAELGEVKGLSKDRIRLWDRPFIVDEMRANRSVEEEKTFDRAMQPFLVGRGTPLWKGRAAHIMGKLTGEQGATVYYQKARPSNRQLIEYEDIFISKEDKKDSESNQKGEEMLQAFYRGKQDASYWLGLVNYSLGDPKSAADYFMNRTLRTAIRGPWHPGAIYNLARCLEQLGEPTKAAEVLRANKTLVAAYGNQLRAEWLDPQRKPEVTPPAEEKPAAPPAAEPKADEPAAEKPAEAKEPVTEKPEATTPPAEPAPAAPEPNQPSETPAEPKE